MGLGGRVEQRLDRVEMSRFHAATDLGGCGASEAGVRSEVGVVGEGQRDVAFRVARGQQAGESVQPQRCLRDLQKRSNRELARWLSAEQQRGLTR